MTLRHRTWIPKFCNFHQTKSAWRDPKSQNFTGQQSGIGANIQGSIVGVKEGASFQLNRGSLPWSFVGDELEPCHVHYLRHRLYKQREILMSLKELSLLTVADLALAVTWIMSRQMRSEREDNFSLRENVYWKRNCLGSDKFSARNSALDFSHCYSDWVTRSSGSNPPLYWRRFLFHLTTATLRHYFRIQLCLTSYLVPPPLTHNM